MNKILKFNIIPRYSKTCAGRSGLNFASSEKTIDSTDSATTFPPSKRHSNKRHPPPLSMVMMTPFGDGNGNSLW